MFVVQLLLKLLATCWGRSQRLITLSINRMLINVIHSTKTHCNACHVQTVWPNRLITRYFPIHQQPDTRANSRPYCVHSLQGREGVTTPRHEGSIWCRDSCRPWEGAGDDRTSRMGRGRACSEQPRGTNSGQRTARLHRHADKYHKGDCTVDKSRSRVTGDRRDRLVGSAGPRSRTKPPSVTVNSS